MFELEATRKIALYSVLWAALLLWTLFRTSTAKQATVGLPYAMLLMYTIAHGGALVHLVPGYDHNASPYLAAMKYTSSTVADGLEVSFLALLAAVIGFAIIEAFMAPNRVPAGITRTSQRRLRTGAIFVLCVGALGAAIQTFAVLVGIELPGFQALLASLRGLFAVGSCGLILYFHQNKDERAVVIAAASLAIILPLIVLVTTAILEDSTIILVSIVIFCLTLRDPIRSPRGVFWRNLFVSASVVIVGFYSAVTYLQARAELREVVWGGEGVSSALSTTIDAIAHFDPGSATSYESLALIDGRLNQNVFIGLAVENTRFDPNIYARGETIFGSFAALVPRFLWPEKPQRGGSEFVSKYTGLMFSSGTTFGAGPIFEFYVNYSYWGVFFGFLMWGAVLRGFDIVAASSLRGSNTARYAQYHLAGLMMLQPLAELFFVLTLVGAAFIVGALLRFLWVRYVPPMRRSLAGRAH